jgi:endonuclease/exonuclease/phosphatase family metal-dependent hydrolase
MVTHTNGRGFWGKCIGSAICLAAAALVLAASTTVSAVTPLIVEWTFETSVPATAGPHSAEGGLNAGSGSPATGSHVGASVYSAPAGNGTTASFSSNTWAVGDYYQFCTSTIGHSGLYLQWEQGSSNTGPRDFELQYSVNGGPYTAFGGTYTVLANATPNPTWSTASASYHVEFHHVIDLSSVTAIDNKAQVCFRFVNNSTVSAIGGVVAVTGTDRVDTVRLTKIGPVDPTKGSCCSGGNCTEVLPGDCVDTFKGLNTLCVSSVCTGACCNGVTCTANVDPVVCANGGGVFQGAGSTCPGTPTCSDCMTLTQVRTVLAGTRVKVCPVVISSTTDLISSGAVASFQIKDSSGPGGQSGMTVFGNTDLILAILSASSGEGTPLSLQGVTSNFNGVLELVDGSLPLRAYAVGANVGLPAPVTISALDLQDLSPTAENFESEVVTLPCVSFLDGDGVKTFAGGVATSNYLVTDGTNTVTVRIASANLDFEGQLIPVGPVSITGIFSQSDTATPFDSVYQLLPRDMFGPHNDLNTSPSCGPTGACCLAIMSQPCNATFTSALCAGRGGSYHGNGSTCSPSTCPIGACCLPGPDCQEITAENCAAQGGVFKGANTLCANQTCPDVTGFVINEIRTDEDGTNNNEYFELKGPANVPLGSLTYLVIGDGAAAAGSGVIEAVIPLTGEVSPADGIFVAAESTFTLGPVDMTTTLNFENDDNVTHLLVKNFTGLNGDDLDTNDDGVLDVTPWGSVLDQVAIIKETNPPTLTEYYYGATAVGPSGTLAPGHILRCPPTNDWVVGTFEVPGNDTPGTANPNVCPCSCPGNLLLDNKIDGKDIAVFIKMILGQTPPTNCADTNLDGVVDLGDVNSFVNTILVGGSCSGDFSPSTSVRVVTYNMLHYNGGASAARKTAFKQVMNAIKPDVLAGEEVSSLGGATDFLNNVLNAAEGPGGYALATYSGAGADNALFYRASKISYGGDHAVITVVDTPRPTDRWKLSVVGGTALHDFYVYGTHLKAGTAAEDPLNPSTRNLTAQAIRADADALAVGSQVIVAGDFNLYNANIVDGANPAEAAWGTFTGGAASVGKMFDPINQIGIWHTNSTFAAIHTQSPHNNNNTLASPAPPGASGGGMDDRFDFMLISANLGAADTVGLSYLAGTYKAFGNDGLHFNNDINDAPVGPTADALHTAADHIPVVMELKINP